MMGRLFYSENKNSISCILCSGIWKISSALIPIILVVYQFFYLLKNLEPLGTKFNNIINGFLGKVMWMKIQELNIVISWITTSNFVTQMIVWWGGSSNILTLHIYHFKMISRLTRLRYNGYFFLQLFWFG